MPEAAVSGGTVTDGTGVVAPRLREGVGVAAAAPGVTELSAGAGGAGEALPQRVAHAPSAARASFGRTLKTGTEPAGSERLFGSPRRGAGPSGTSRRAGCESGNRSGPPG